MKKLNIALIGIGHVGSRHLKTYKEQLTDKVHLVGICDIEEKRTQKFCEHYHVPFIADHRKLFGVADAVDICVPTSDHFALAKYFLERKTHVFLEKPMTLTVAEAQKLIDLAQKNNLKLQVGHVERFNSAFTAVASIAKTPLFIECHRLNQFPNRSLDIGVVIDLMIHDIDIVLGLVRSPLKEVKAVGVPVLTPKEDIANARLTFANGCVCNLTASRVSDEVMRKIRIFLPDTYISLDYVKQEAFVYKKNGTLISKSSLPIEKEEPLKQELESFADCVLKDRRPIVSGEEGRDALEVALDISQKIWKNPLITS